jgi:dipeptidyl aminopeptidase/acylaminoacyl peptidase
VQKLIGRVFGRVLIVAAAVGGVGLRVGMGQAAIKYQHPPQAMERLLEAPVTPVAMVSPDGKTLAMEQPETLSTIAELSEPRLRLAGLRFNPLTNGQTAVPYATRLSLQAVGGGPARPVTDTPSGLKILYVKWSPDGHWLSFVQRQDGGPGGLPRAGLELFVVDAKTAEARRLGSMRLNGVLGDPCAWMPDSKALLCRVVPSTRGAEPKRATAPEGPDVSENLGRVSPGRTYEDLLQNPEDERFFEYYATAQLAIVPVAGSVRALPGLTGLIEQAKPSPDGRYALVVERHRPFSYALPVDFFPLKVAVVDLKTGKVVKQLADEPLADSISIAFDAVAPGPRNFAWRSDVPATVTWVQAGDGGDPAKKVPVHDRLFALAAPFAGEPETLLEMPLRFTSVEWGNEHLALVSERERKTRKRLLVALDPSAKTGKTIFEGSSEDRYHDLGKPVTVPNATGQSALKLTADGAGIYFLGEGASPQGDQPFVGVLPVSGGEAGEQKIWQSKAPFYEEPIDVLADDRVLVRRESETVPPNYFVVTPESGALAAVTHYPSPYGSTPLPVRTVLHYKRADGLDLSANLWVPAGYDKSKGPLPTLIEAYPAEFKTRGAAGQVQGSPYRYPRIGWGSPVFFTATGYAVFENASIPIVGEGKQEPNDTYVQQLLAGAKAAVDYGASLGVVDPKRVAVMGHSYGAFMTANLLAHTTMFRAGIARSGAYNRSLTPYGFQNEERTYWQDPELYYAMSPFSFADKIKTPLLLIHGEADDNDGTFPIQSDRFYVALKGQGATVRLVFLPLEAHHYMAHESLDHMLWEMNRWLDTYVKPEQPVTGAGAATETH